MTTRSPSDKFFETAGLDFTLGEPDDKWMPFTMATKAGRIAFHAGVPIKDNPETDEQMRQAWIAGWNAESVVAMDI